MGDIFRRNALNLGLHVVQSPEAVADAHDGDEFTVRSATRRLTNVTQAKTYTPLPLTAKEDEIRRSGGIIAVGRREFRESVERRPIVEFPDESLARSMTTTEQIVWAHRVDKDRSVLLAGRHAARLCRSAAGVGRHGAVCDPHVQPDHGGRSHLSAAGGHRQRSLRLHRPRRRRASRRRSAGRSHRQHGLTPPYYATPGDGIFHFYFPEQGLVMPGQFIPGRRFAQPRLRRLRRRRHRRGIDDARVRLGDRLRLLHAAERARVVFPGACSRGSAARTSSSSCCAAGAHSSRRACRLSSSTRSAAADRLSQHHRQHDGGSGGAQRHLCRRRDHARVVRGQGDHGRCRIRSVVPGASRAVRDRRGAVAGARCGR